MNCTREQKNLLQNDFSRTKAIKKRAIGISDGPFTFSFRRFGMSHHLRGHFNQDKTQFVFLIVGSNPSPFLLSVIFSQINQGLGNDAGQIQF